MSAPPVAAWLPPALRETPDGEPDAPRLLDLLLAGVDEQRRVLEQDIDAVWEDFFIESCADWAVPHIGALLGLPLDAGRSEVAYAVALRRRKGTPAALEDFAEVLTGLDGARAGGLADHALGPAAAPSAAAARRRRSICGTARAFASARRSSACAAA